jgi:protein transport protein SEC24
MDGMEIEFANHLVEDSNNDALSYTDCKFIFFHMISGEELTLCRPDDCT